MTISQAQNHERLPYFGIFVRVLGPKLTADGTLTGLRLGDEVRIQKENPGAGWYELTDRELQRLRPRG